MKFIPALNFKSLLWAAVRIAVALYLLVLVLLLVWQERLIFAPEVLPSDFEYKFSLPFDQRWIESGGLRADSLLFRRAGAPGTILYFHGNAGSLNGWGHVAAELAERTGWNVWILDYPGYGRSEGRISSEKQLHDLAAAFYRVARAEMGANANLAIFGRSIGSGVAVHLASELSGGADQPSALILESPYMSVAAVAHELFPWVPGFLLRYTLHSDEWIPKVFAPVLILHGDQDEIIPFAQGLELAKRVHGGAKFVEVKGGHHNDLSDFPAYWNALLDFFGK